MERNQSLAAELEAHAAGDDAAHHVLTAIPDHAGNRDRREKVDHGIVHGVGQDRVLERVHVAAVDLREALVGLALSIEQLQHHHAADMFLQIRVDACDGRANAPVRVPHPVAENLGRKDDERQHGESDQRQLPVHRQHDAENAGQHEQILEDRDHSRGEHFVQRIDVGGDPRDQPADRVFVVEPDVHALQVAENLAAQIKHDLLPCPLHEVGLQELEQKREHQQAEVDRRNLRDAGERARAEPTPQACGRSFNGRQVTVDGDLHQVRPQHICKSLENDRTYRHRHLPAVGPQVGEQSPHQPAIVGLA